VGFIKINSTWFYVTILPHLVQTKAIKQQQQQQQQQKGVTNNPPPSLQTTDYNLSNLFALLYIGVSYYTISFLSRVFLLCIPVSHRPKLAC